MEDVWADACGSPEQSLLPPSPDQEGSSAKELFCRRRVPHGFRRLRVAVREEAPPTNTFPSTRAEVHRHTGRDWASGEVAEGVMAPGGRTAERDSPRARTGA